jgi:hypothetical protein
MENFILIYTSELTIKEKSKIEKILKKHKDEKTTDAFCLHKVMMTDSKEYNTIKKMIFSMKANPTVSTIILIDYKQDNCYVFKAHGNLENIKKKTLPAILMTYEKISKTEAFFGKVFDARFIVESVINQ